MGFLTYGCENDPSTIGLEALPSSDLLSANSTENIIYGSNFVPDSIVSDNSSMNQYPYGIIGYFNDPMFGRTKADMVTEVTLSANPPDFRYDPATGEIDEAKFFPDSVVLNLAYVFENWYGDPEAEHTIQVYELAERLDTAFSDSRYFSDFEILGKYYSQLLGQKTISAADTLSDSTWQSQNYVNVISLTLDNQLRDKLFNLTEDELKDRNLLKNRFNGLYITTTDPADPTRPGSLIKINLEHELTNLTLHYRKEFRELVGEDDEEGTLLEVRKMRYIFPINPEARSFNRFEHDHTDKIEVNTPNAERLMIQGMAGSQAQIDLRPLIAEWADSLTSTDPKYGISGVDLIFYADTFHNSPDLFTPINTTLSITHRSENNIPIVASAVDKDGENIPAFRFSSASYDAENNSYTFSMNQAYFEKAARGELEVTPFYLTIPFTQFSFKRVILFNNVSDHPPVFKVRYVTY
ncbi:hypothetical protein JCM15548_12093 [Geofilum rubicundum JCM 15548]|uniref:DUF4270 domain-containing protein n=2 Tax=Geofilum TaxID=1236988 RepID=A0A0E9LWB6_9BACT|nr:hypothetical protein JCM15548_12093 [Geofilum rubicundum JCM 15548]